MSYLNPLRFPSSPKLNVRGAFGGLNHKNPFKGIACKSHRLPHHSRHIEGARDTRPSYHARRRDDIFDIVYFNGGEVRPFRDTNPIPCAFLP